MKFEQIKSEIKAKYPDFKELPLLTRLKVRMFDHPSTCTDTYTDGDGPSADRYSQTYKTYYVNGKFYFYKFGW